MTIEKKAEELRIKICKLQGETIAGYISKDTYFQQVDFLIASAIRQQRESAAERMTAAYNGRGSLRNFKEMRAAILKED